MHIQLQRAFSPEYMVEEECGICGIPFRVASVVAYVTTVAGGTEAGEACPECIAYLGQRHPERFPSIEEYRAAVERYPSPMFSSVTEILRLEEEDHHAGGRVLAASYVR